MIDIKRFVNNHSLALGEDNGISTKILVNSEKDFVLDNIRGCWVPVSCVKSSFEKFLIELLEIDLAQKETIKFSYGNFGLVRDYVRIFDENSCLEFEWYTIDEEECKIYLEPRAYNIKLLKSNKETFSLIVDFIQKVVHFSITPNDDTIFEIKISIASGFKDVAKIENIINVVDDGVFEAMNRLSIDECFEKIKELLGETIYNLDIKIKNDMPIGMVSSVGSASNMIKLHKGSLQAFCIETPFESIRINSKQNHYINEGISFARLGLED